MKIIIGDSHVSFFEQAGIIKSHWMGPTHTATIFQLRKLGLDLYHLQEALAQSDHYVNVGVPIWKCPSGVYDTPNIQPGDTVLFSYGFNDMQKNIHLHAKDRPEYEIRELVDDYIMLLKNYESKYQVKCVVCEIPPNPLPRINAVGAFEYGIGGEFKAEGSSKDRAFYTKFANSYLQKKCEFYNLRWLNLYSDLTDTDGFLIKDYTTDYVHLTHTNKELVDKMRLIIESVSFE